MVTDESFSLQIKGIHPVFCKNWGSDKSTNALPESVPWKTSGLARRVCLITVMPFSQCVKLKAITGGNSAWW